MAINIPSLFSDIIETDQQRQTRLLTEGALLGRELTGNLRTGAGASLGQRLTATAAPTVTAIAGQLPQRREDIRRAAGGMLGLDVRTEGEKVQDMLRGADVTTPEGLKALADSIQTVAPAQSTRLRQESVKLASEQAAQSQQAKELEQQRLQTLSQRDSMTRFVELADLSNQEKQAFLGSVESGLYDNKVKDLVDQLSSNVEGRYRTVGNFIFDERTRQFLSPPSASSAGPGIVGIDADLFDVQSIGRYNRAMADPEI